MRSAAAGNFFFQPLDLHVEPTNLLVEFGLESLALIPLFGDGRRRRAIRRRRPEWSSFRGPPHLSTAAPGLPTTTLIPPPGEVANAAAALTANSAQAFANYANALGILERHSAVTPAQFDALVQDNAAIDASIENSNLSSGSIQDKINLTADHIDAAFTDPHEAPLHSEIKNLLSGVDVSPEVLHRTFAEMSVIGHAARAHAPKNALLGEARYQAAVSSNLGPSPDIDIWPGPKRDPQVVYFNGQIGNFVRVR